MIGWLGRRCYVYRAKKSRRGLNLACLVNMKCLNVCEDRLSVFEQLLTFIDRGLAEFAVHLT